MQNILEGMSDAYCDAMSDMLSRVDGGDAAVVSKFYLSIGAGRPYDVQVSMVDGGGSRSNVKLALLVLGYKYMLVKGNYDKLEDGMFLHEERFFIPCPGEYDSDQFRKDMFNIAYKYNMDYAAIWDHDARDLSVDSTWDGFDGRKILGFDLFSISKIQDAMYYDYTVNNLRIGFDVCGAGSVYNAYDMDSTLGSDGNGAIISDAVSKQRKEMFGEWY